MPIYCGRDCVAVLPTGYGKSMIFHLLPAFLTTERFLQYMSYSSNRFAFHFINHQIEKLLQRIERHSDFFPNFSQSIWIVN